MTEAYSHKDAEPGDYTGFSDDELIAEFEEVTALLTQGDDEAEHTLAERWHAVTGEIEYRNLKVKKG